MNRAPGAVLSAEDLRAVIGLLQMIAGWLDNTGPDTLGDLRAHLRAHGAGLQAEDLPNRICHLTAMLRYRQVTGGTP